MRMLTIISFILAVLVFPAFAETQEPLAVEDELINVSADRLEADEIKRTVTFYGQVKARQAGMVMYADRMTLYYNADQSEDVDRVEIDGGLRIVQEGRVATADRGVFLNREGQILLSGNAEVHQGGNRIVGDEIIYFINEARSVVKSQPDSRVNAVFRPGGKQK